MRVARGGQPTIDRLPSLYAQRMSRPECPCSVDSISAPRASTELQIAPDRYGEGIVAPGTVAAVL